MLLHTCRFFLVAVCLSFFCSTVSYGQSNPDFRSVNWGASKDEVKSTEVNKKIIFENDNTFVVSDILDGLEVEVVYLFVNNKLVRTKYTITEKYSNPDAYIVKYNALYGLLSSKYGKGKQTSLVPDQYKRNNSNLGVGVGIGKVKFLSEWEKPKSRISLVLMGNNFDVVLGIEYASIELAPLEAEMHKNKTLEKL
jgi:hypothetical protein